jgi:CheY-like chemotaxis protein
VRVSARLGERGEVLFDVADTGIGIAPEDQVRIFEEFGQLDSPLQRRVKGTGLGLPLSQKLAALLGGKILVQSQPGIGSTFTLCLPVNYFETVEGSSLPEGSGPLGPLQLPVLVLEDSRESLFLYEKLLRGTAFQIVPASSVKAAQQLLHEVRPAAVILDILLQGENAWDFLAELKRSEPTRSIPVLVVTLVDNERQARTLGADAFAIKPVQRDWLVRSLAELTRDRLQAPILVVDDDAGARSLLATLLAGTRHEVLEASGADDGLRRARNEKPAAIFLDLMMPDRSGYEVLDDLRADPATARIPVIIYSARYLDEHERGRLMPLVSDIVGKEEIGPHEAGRLRLQTALQRARIGSEGRI